MFNKTNENLISQTTKIKQSVIKLAYFDPTATDEYCNQVIDYLVLDSLANYGHLLQSTASQIKTNIKDVSHLDFEDSEINASAKRLGLKGIINYIEGTLEEKRRGEKPIFQILPKTEEKITSNILKFQEIEKEVIKDWKLYLIDRYNDYPIVKDNIELIAENLQLFISKLLIRHGRECVAILYPEEKKTQDWLASIKNNILNDLPKVNSFIDPIMRFEIPNFFKSIEPNRKFYISSMFNSSFFWHLIQVDEKCSKLLRQVTKGQKLFLDNNILYSLVGLHGRYLLKAVHRILEMANKLGYKLMVTTKTIDEFQESLRHGINDIKPIPKELARVAAENLEKDNFILCYWEEFVKDGISIQEFVTEKSHLEDIMTGLNIESTNKFRKDIENSDELKEEESMLQSVVPFTNKHIINHDAFHRVFIKKMRKGEKYNFSEAKAWFLTHDKKLPSYGKVARKGSGSLPFCLLTNQWVQLNRPLLTRTSDENEYKESFYTLVTQPYLRAMMSSLSMEKTYNEVMGKLARYKNMNPQLTLSIVTDTHFMVTVALEDNEEEIEEKIENKFVDIANQLQKEKEILGEDTKNKTDQIKILQERIGNVENKIEENKILFNKQIGKFKEVLKGEKKKRENAEEETKNIKKEFEDFKKKLSAKRKLWVTITIFIFLEIIVGYLALKYESGDNFWQKLRFSWQFFSIPLGISIILGWFIIGKERLVLLGWTWNKIFKIKEGGSDEKQTK